MAKNHAQKRKIRKSVIAMLCALAVTCTGLAAACAPEKEDDPSTAVSSREDNQLLKNGNFEHFDIPDKAVHLIRNVNNWTLGGDTSVKSGIISTATSDWDKLTAEDLAGKLDYNNDLSSSDESYVDYNSMRSRDLLYMDNYAATLADDDVEDSLINKFEGGYEGYFRITGEGTDEKPYKWNNGVEEVTVYKNEDNGEFYLDAELTKLIRKQQIVNPETHYGAFKEEDGKYYFGTQQVYADDKGNYFLDADKKTETVGNVLMIHNSPTDTRFNGVHQYYSSATVTLEARTSAEISLWVKTSDLKFDKGYYADGNEQDKGAYIEVIQTVAGKSLDSFSVKAINTEKIIAGADKSGLATTESNGWLQYTVYVNACDFAESTVQIRLGLGSPENNEKVTGYAFFDDVEIKKYRDLEADDTDCTYKDFKNEITTNKTSCTLTSDEDAKIFYADVETRYPGSTPARHAYDFHYLIDLASENGVSGNYASFTFGTNVTAGLTVETDSKGVDYVAALKNDAKINGLTPRALTSNIRLPKDVKERPTENDLLGAFNIDHKFVTSDFNSGVKDGDIAILNKNLTIEGRLPDEVSGGTSNSTRMLVMYSAWGAPYAATVSDNVFSLRKNEYMLISFWVKTSDMGDGTALTAKIYELDSKGEVVDDSAKTLAIDTTGKTTDFEKQKDIYNGWVQCFFFAKNETGKDGDAAKTFKIDFSFGTTSLISATSFESGYAAVANMQTLKIDEDIYNLASSGDTTALFSFNGNSDDDGGTPMDDATGTSDIRTEVSVPDSYSGRNGANSSGNVSNRYAGLINREHIGNYTGSVNENYILTSFDSAATTWDSVFGKNCYQPLIIINHLRTYTLQATATEDTFENYYIKLDNDTTETDYITGYDGNKYKSAKGTTFDEKKTYYSLNKAMNYGFVGESKTVSANSRETVSVRVKVTGDAVAYIYLTDGNEIISYTTPAYTFFYDEEGNVLDAELDEDWTTAEHRSHIVYTLRKDGLYDGKDGKIYANLYNLIKTYKDSKYEHNAFYDKDGNIASFDNLKDGETYYKSATISDDNIADHYLCNTDGTQVYEYIDGKYYYLENNKTTTEVTNFDPMLARYYDKPDIDQPMVQKVTAADCANLGDADGWVTVNFVIQTGSESKSYRLELWSGARNEKGFDDDGNFAEGAIAFDYSHSTVSDTRLAAYEKEIVTAYNNALKTVDATLLDQIPSGTKENIAFYEDLIAALSKPQQDAIKAELTKLGYENYSASYYTYTLYDSASYIPFNANTAKDGETGYDYDASSFEEKLAYFGFNDVSRHEKNIFVDYTVVDQDIKMNTVDDDDSDEDDDTRDTSEFGLYIASIVLVVVLLITLVSILTTQYLKNKKKKNAQNANKKNVYRKRERYVKKVNVDNDEISSEQEIANDGDLTDDNTVSEESATEPQQENASEAQPGESEPETKATETQHEVTEQPEVTEPEPDATEQPDGEKPESADTSSTEDAAHQSENADKKAEASENTEAGEDGNSDGKDKDGE